MDISADVREVVAHERCVHDDALYKSTFTLLLYFSYTLGRDGTFHSLDLGGYTTLAEGSNRVVDMIE